MIALNAFEQFSLDQKQQRREIMALAVTTGQTVSLDEGQVTARDAVRRQAQESRPGRKIAKLKTVAEIDALMSNPAALNWMTANLPREVVWEVHILASERRAGVGAKTWENQVLAAGRRFFSAQSESELDRICDDLSDDLAQMSLSHRERVANLHEKALRRIRETSPR